MKTRKRWKARFRRQRWRLLGLLLLFVWFWNFLPDPLFDQPTCTVLLDRQGELLGARIASDGQWRFPPSDSVPHKFEVALLQFEDRHFYSHPGINPVSLFNALKRNLQNGRVVRGGSTISMQVIRMARKGQARTYWEKIIEMVQALRMECSYRKADILKLYASNAPFGGNVVGLEAAAWRYYGRPAHTLSWAESATLAVLPNAPSLIFPGRNQERLKLKRNLLLHRLWQNDYIDSATCALSQLEDLPGKPLPLPQLAPHLLDRSAKDGHHGQRITTTLEIELQARAQEAVKRHLPRLRANEIYNLAAVILEVESGATRAYIGNVAAPTGQVTGQQVDCAMAPRSTGSILKPLLYAQLMQEGDLLPAMLVPDIPTHISGYTPKNFDQRYDGAVPAHLALSRSLNVPAVRLLRDFGTEKFHHLLQQLPFTTFNRSADHYGLSLILGGAEARLYELCGTYASMSRSLNHFRELNSRYAPEDWHPPHYLLADAPPPLAAEGHATNAPLTAGATYTVYEAMQEVARPLQDEGWQAFAGSRQVAWKTGTSFGFRDGWAIGTTPRHVVGVWVGNADGEGRPGLTGVGAAAPVMFDLFRLLRPESRWFEVPYDDLQETVVCQRSGYQASPWCPDRDTTWVAASTKEAPACPFHQRIHTDLEGRYRVSRDCVPASEMVAADWFVLPPVQAWYYQQRDPNYRRLPSFAPGCGPQEEEAVMEWIYPREASQLFVPLELNGEVGRVVFELAHRNPKASVFWHLDGEYLGDTRLYHQMGVAPAPGWHLMVAIDEAGNTLKKRFQVVDRER